MSALIVRLSGVRAVDCLDTWWERTGSWVEAPNQRRGGESGVQFLLPSVKHPQGLYCKRQTNHLYYSWRHPFGCPTIVREQAAYQALARCGVRTPKVVYCATRKRAEGWQAIFVTEALTGFISLEQYYAKAAATADKRAVLEAIGATLAKMHQAGIAHGCCYPKHIFIQEATAAVPVQVALLDLEKARFRRFTTAGVQDMRQLDRHRGSIPKADMALLLRAHQRALHQTL